jgi:hypothetical protein
VKCCKARDYSKLFRALESGKCFLACRADGTVFPGIIILSHWFFSITAIIQSGATDRRIRATVASRLDATTKPA